IGQPVFVRYLLHTAIGSVHQAETLERIAAVLSEWFGQPFDCRHTTCSKATGQVSSCLQAANGTAAMVSFAPSAMAAETVDLTLLGPHGAIYHLAEYPPPFEDEKYPADPPASRQPRYGVLLVSGNHTHQEDYALAFAADPRCRLIAVTDESGVD